MEQRRRARIIASLALALPLSAAEWQRFEAVEPHMGTLVSIQLYAPSEAVAREGFQAAFARIHQLDLTFSDYLPASELSRLHAARELSVSRDFHRLLQVALRLARDSGGAFDLSIGAQTQVWREARRQQRLLTPAEQAAALAQSGYRRVQLRGRTVRLPEGMRLDFGAIAKGFAAGEALEVLRRRGLRQALIAISGDLAIGAPPPGASGWRVTIPSARLLVLRQRAVSTSGATEQSVKVAGVTYSHILDPRTATPLTSASQITVVAGKGAIADGLATAIAVLDAASGTRLAAKYRTQLFRVP